MKKVITYGLIFIAGAAVGGGIGWFVTKTHYEKIMDERVAEESEENRKWYEDLIEQERNDIRREWEMDEDEEADVEKASIVRPDANAELVSSIDDQVKDAVDNYLDSYTERMNRRKEDLLRPERVRYETFSKPKPKEEEVDEVRLTQNDDDPRSDIYVINADQFAHERYGFDKVTLYWWELERILSEEDMDILDVPDLLGTNWESHIGEEEKDIVYVRNENLETDYEVVVQHESFYAMRD